MLDRLRHMDVQRNSIGFSCFDHRRDGTVSNAMSAALIVDGVYAN